MINFKTPTLILDLPDMPKDGWKIYGKAFDVFLGWWLLVSHNEAEYIYVTGADSFVERSCRNDPSLMRSVRLRNLEELKWSTITRYMNSGRILK